MTFNSHLFFIATHTWLIHLVVVVVAVLALAAVIRIAEILRRDSSATSHVPQDARTARLQPRAFHTGSFI